ncbi:MAG: hypothetical protein E3J72_14540 [Planctomycetota bacterium]|nr:MAG: hypothetical protein E3J72_14540 [Planctomycetota bacterium]
MKSFLAWLVIAVLVFQLAGCVIGPLPPSAEIDDPQQASDLSPAAAYHRQKKQDIKFMEDEEGYQPSWDEEDWKYSNR